MGGLMFKGRGNGKKLLAARLVKHTFEIINLMTDLNPVQVLVDAVAKGGAREDSTRVGSGGVVRRQAVDVSPMRRVDEAIYLMCKGARASAFRNLKTMPECLTDELVNAAKDLELVRHQEEGRDGARRQGQPLSGSTIAHARVHTRYLS